jgi:hypothetical protein
VQANPGIRTSVSAIQSVLCRLSASFPGLTSA